MRENKHDSVTGSPRSKAAPGDDDDIPELSDHWFAQAELRGPTKKELVSIRLDDDVLAWFRSIGPGYQTRINQVLRTFMTHQVGREKTVGMRRTTPKSGKKAG